MEADTRRLLCLELTSSVEGDRKGLTGQSFFSLTAQNSSPPKTEEPTAHVNDEDASKKNRSDKKTKPNVRSRRVDDKEPFKLTIPLTHVDHPSMELDEKLKKAIDYEYAVRYLENLGVSPTKENTDTVLAQIPIEEQDITAFYRSRGWHANYLQVSPSTLVKGRKVKLRTLGQYEGALASLVTARIHDEVFEQDAAAVHGKKQTEATKPVGDIPNFEEMKRKFVYPYYQGPKTTPARVMNTTISLAGTSQLQSTGLVDRTSPPKSHRSPYAVRHRSPVSAEKALEFGKRYLIHKPTYIAPRFAGNDVKAVDEADEELATKSFDSGTKLISTVQHGFVEKFNFDIAQHRLSQKSINTLKMELLSHQLGELISMMVEYLYWTYIAEKVMTIKQNKGLDSDLTSVVIQKNQRQFFLAIHQNIIRHEEKIERKMGRLTFYMPVIFLMIRVCIEAVFRKNYPKWVKVKEGTYMLQLMDDTLVNIIDPDKYHLHISLVESTNEAMRLASAPNRFQERSILHKFYGTSPLVRCLFPKFEGRPVHIPKYAQDGNGAEWLPSFEANDEQKRQLYHLALERIHVNRSDVIPHIDNPSDTTNGGKTQRRNQEAQELQTTENPHFNTTESKTEFPPLSKSSPVRNSGLDMRTAVLENTLGQTGSVRANMTSSGEVLNGGNSLQTTQDALQRTPTRLVEIDPAFSQFSASTMKFREIQHKIKVERNPELEALEKEKKEREELSNIIQEIITEFPKKVAAHTIAQSKSPSPPPNRPQAQPLKPVQSSRKS